ncbi:MAG: class I SAM-dependent methyltransferase [Steroidobacteraceae bacterium]
MAIEQRLEEQIDERMMNPRTPARALAARLEPFDSYWQAPQELEKGFGAFGAYYRANYLPHLPADRDASILVVSCGPGYLVSLLRERGYRRVIGIDSDAAKVAFAARRKLPCEQARAFAYLEGRRSAFDVIVPEQELNHLTLDETVEFLGKCKEALRPGGRVIVYAMNGANPFVGSENLSHNVDHFYNVTEYSLEQILKLGGFDRIEVFPLKLYVFWKNPLNYVGLAATSLIELALRVVYRLYGKKVRVLSKKIAAVAFKPE